MTNAIMFRGISKKGKNRISENGCFWIPIREAKGSDLSFTEDSDRWVLLEATNTRFHRWFNTKGDKHFERVA